MFHHWSVHPETIFSASLVIPVLVIRDLEHAIPLASALFAGGIKVLEITLRTPVALEAIALLCKEFPEALIGAGTVRNSDQLEQAKQAGARFAISPGQTQTLLKAGKKGTIPLIPGIATPSELMEGLEAGYTHFKLFPAVAVGGVDLLRAFSGPFPDVRFCPTGGIHENNYADFLVLPNVSCVGGSWIVPDEAIKNSHWSRITELCLSVLPRQQ